jgi:hypothetical protein
VKATRVASELNMVRQLDEAAEVISQVATSLKNAIDARVMDCRCFCM